MGTYTIQVNLTDAIYTNLTTTYIFTLIVEEAPVVSIGVIKKKSNNDSNDTVTGVNSTHSFI